MDKDIGSSNSAEKSTSCISTERSQTKLNDERFLCEKIYSIIGKSKKQSQNFNRNESLEKCDELKAGNIQETKRVTSSHRKKIDHQSTPTLSPRFVVLSKSRNKAATRKSENRSPSTSGRSLRRNKSKLRIKINESETNNPCSLEDIRKIKKYFEASSQSSSNQQKKRISNRNECKAQNSDGVSHSIDMRVNFLNETSYRQSKTKTNESANKSKRSTGNNYTRNECTDIGIDYESLRRCLKHSTSLIKKFDVLQSIRLRIASQTSIERENTIRDIVDNDLFDIRSDYGASELLKNLLWPINLSTSHPIQTSTAKLLNTIVSHQIGREYFNTASVVHLLTWSKRETIDVTMADNLMAVMMKLSIVRFQRLDMIKKGLFKWLTNHMKEVKYSATKYHLEYMTELLKVLTTVENFNYFSSDNILHTIDLLVSYLDTDNPHVKINIICSLRVLFKNKKAAKIANNSGLQEIIQDLIKKTSDSKEMQNLEVISKLLNNSQTQQTMRSSTDERHTVSDTDSSAIEHQVYPTYSENLSQNFSVKFKRKYLEKLPSVSSSIFNLEVTLKRNHSSNSQHSHCYDKLTNIVVESIRYATNIDESAISPIVRDNELVTTKNSNRILAVESSNIESYRPSRNARKSNKSTQTCYMDNYRKYNRHTTIEQAVSNTWDENAEDSEDMFGDLGPLECDTVNMADERKVVSEQSNSQHEIVLSEKKINDINSNNSCAVISNESNEYMELIRKTNDPEIRKNILENDSFIDELCKKVFHKLQEENIFCGPNCGACSDLHSYTKDALTEDSKHNSDNNEQIMSHRT